MRAAIRRVRRLSLTKRRREHVAQITALAFGVVLEAKLNGLDVVTQSERTKQPIPNREATGVVGIGFHLNIGVVHAVHARRDNQQPQKPIQGRRDTNVGVMNTLTEIREAVLDPNKRFTKGYMPVRVTLSNGESIRGVARNTSNYSIQLLDADGELRLLSKSGVSQVEFPKSSWMPDNYGERLSDEQVTDLLAFLSRQSIRPIETDEGDAQ